MSHQKVITDFLPVPSKRHREDDDDVKPLCTSAHPEDPLRWGPSGGGNRETMSERQVVVPRIPGQSSRHRDWDARAAMPKVERTDLASEFVESSNVFAGCVVHINTAAVHPELSMFHASKIVQANGGVGLVFPSSSATHYVTSQLSFAKKDLRNNCTHIVTPQWIVDCVKEKRRMPEGRYPVPGHAASAKGTMAGFFVKK